MHLILHYQFAQANEDVENQQWMQQNLPLCDEWINAKNDDYHYIAGFRQGKLDVVVFITRQPKSTELNWIESLFAQPQLDDDQWSALLRAEPDQAFKQGKTICSCFQIGENTILRAINEGANSVQDLGDKLKCGTNCGSCKPELSQLLEKHKVSSEQLIMLEAV